MSDNPTPIPVDPDDFAPLVEVGVVDDAAARSNRVGRTATQVGLPTSLIVIGTWGARLGELDLDPGPGVDMPADVTAAFVFVATWLLARYMNRAPK